MSLLVGKFFVYSGITRCFEDVLFSYLFNNHEKLSSPTMIFINNITTKANLIAPYTRYSRELCYHRFQHVNTDSKGVVCIPDYVVNSSYHVGIDIEVPDARHHLNINRDISMDYMEKIKDIVVAESNDKLNVKVIQCRPGELSCLLTITDEETKSTIDYIRRVEKETSDLFYQRMNTL